MRALLDVNVLIALLDAGHVQHGVARDWLLENHRLGWASCPITQNGCIRVMAQPSYPHPRPVAEIAARLRHATSHPSHVLWAADISALDAGKIDATRIHGAKQLTDAYLLALAVANGGRFVTFDRAVSLAAAVGADQQHLVVL